jgi:molybdate transport system substrate-binding protein
MQVAARLRTFAGLLFIVATTAANATEIHVYSSGAPAVAAKVIATDFGKVSDDHFDFTVDQPAMIEADLAAGDTIDVVILPEPLVKTLTGSGVLRSDGTANVARVGAGIVVRAGAPTPNIADVAAIRQLLRDAHSIVYPDPAEAGGGSAGLAIARMIEKLGLTDIVRPKLTVKSAIGGGVALVAEGKAEVGIFNTSEIMPVKGVTLIGPLPSELQNYILFTAAIPVKSTVPEPASAYIKRLTDPATRPAWQNAGLEPVAPSR